MLTKKERFLLAEKQRLERQIKRLQEDKGIRRKTRKEPALDTVIKTETGIHHFIHKERKDTQYEFTKLTQDSKKISFGKIGDIWGSLEFYAYENNKKYFYIALNGKVRQFDKHEMRKLMCLNMRAGRHMGILGRKSKKMPKTMNQ